MRLAADTNIFVYAVDERDPRKRQIAQDLVVALIDAGASISLQVIGELQSALTRRLKVPATIAADESRKLLQAFSTIVHDQACVEMALDEAAFGRFSYWDALMLATCSDAAVDVLFTEDLQDGSRFRSVRIINPFGPVGLSSSALDVLER